jgi:hypothetical protein
MLAARIIPASAVARILKRVIGVTVYPNLKGQVVNE